MFLGQDRDGNYYWTSTYFFHIYNKNFEKVTVFTIPSVEEANRNGPYPFIDGDGNIYGFTVDTAQKLVDVNFLKRDW